MIGHLLMIVGMVTFVMCVVIWSGYLVFNFNLPLIEIFGLMSLSISEIILGFVISSLSSS